MYLQCSSSTTRSPTSSTESLSLCHTQTSEQLRSSPQARGSPPNPTHIQCRAVQPNPSLKRSAHGRPPGPAAGYGVHFPAAGPGVLPLSPA